MRHKRQWVTIGAGIVGLCLLAGMGEAKSLLAKTESSEKATAVESKQIQWQVKLPQALDGTYDVLVKFYADQELAQLLEEKIYPTREIQGGIVSLPLDAAELGLETGKNYGVRVAVIGEDIETETQVSILPRQLAVTGSDDGVITGRFNFSGSYPYPDYFMQAANTANGYGAIISSNGGVGIYGKTSGAVGYGVLAENLTGTALYSKGDAEVEGDLTVTGQTTLAAIDLPDSSVTTNDIYDGTIRQNDLAPSSVTSTQIQDGSITNVDISSTAAISGSKIDRTELDADLLDGLDSTAFVRTTGDLTLSGNLTVNGIGNNYFAGNVGIGTMTPAYKLHVVGGAVVSDVGGAVVSDAGGTVVSDIPDTYPWGMGVRTSQSWGRWGRQYAFLSDAGEQLAAFVAHGTTGNTIDDVVIGGGINSGGYEQPDRQWLTIKAITGNVGIGTTSPAQKLDVAGTIQTQGFKLTTGAANGYILTSDASGAGTWQPAAGGGGGDITSVIAGSGLTGGGLSGDVTLSVGPGAITSNMITDGTIAQADVSNGYIDLVNEQNIAGRKVFTSQVFFNGQTAPNAVGILAPNGNALGATNAIKDYAAVFAQNLSSSSGNPNRGMAVEATVYSPSFVGISTNGKGYFGGGFTSSLETSQGELMVSVPLTKGPQVYLSGSAQIRRGQTRISFDSNEQDIIADSEYQVIITPTAMCQGLAVTKKNQDGFVVEELGYGKGNATFDWLVIARKAHSLKDQSPESLAAILPDTKE